MSNRGEVWVHGSSAMAQYPGGEGPSPFNPDHRLINATDPERPTSRRVFWSDLLGVRSELGATFRGAFGGTNQPNTNCFYFSIPTPAIAPWPTSNQHDHREITVDVVSLYYKFNSQPPSDQITIQSIGVTDGPGQTQRIDNIFREGLNADRSVRPQANFNNWHISPIRLRLGDPHGIVISAKVRFDVEGEITFTGAAIHYRVN